jgi:hypothetical protein
MGVIPGKNWHYRFQRQHPNLALSHPAALDPKQAENFNEENIKHYFDLLENLKTQYPKSLPEHIWNMDKKGIQLRSGIT